MPTILSLLRSATEELNALSDTPKLDAEVLMRHILSRDAAWLAAHLRDEVTSEIHDEFDTLLAQRLEGHPIAYLTGSREFWSMNIHVTPDVLIPRPETETMIEAALKFLPPSADWRVADLGTGSGGIAFAIALERPKCRVTATDISAAALKIARVNSINLGITGIEFLTGDWYAPLEDRRFDLIISNPPYVTDDDEHLRQGDVRYEPAGALKGGADGLDEIRRIVLGAADHLEPGGRIMIEHGFDQGDAVRAEMLRHGFLDIETLSDLSGQPRVTWCRNQSSSSR